MIYGEGTGDSTTGLHRSRKIARSGTVPVCTGEVSVDGEKFFDFSSPIGFQRPRVHIYRMLLCAMVDTNREKGVLNLFGEFVKLAGSGAFDQ